MGLLSNLTKADQSARSDKVLNTQPDQDPYRYSRQARETGNAQARSLWNDVFRASRPKKPDEKPGYAQRPFPGGSSGRSVAGGEASFVRLLQAMRSMAPGGWSDDRWEQTARHFTGITYVAVHRICMQLRRAEFQVFLQDHSHPDGKRPATERDEAWELVRLLKRPNRQDSFGNLMYCFPAGVRVRMVTGEQKCIEDVGIGERVLTAEGNIGEVEQLHRRHYEGDLTEVHLWGHRHLRMTPNHEVLTKRGYVPAGQLESGDWVRIPRYVIQARTTTLDTKKHLEHFLTTKTKRAKKRLKPVPDQLPLTRGLGWILGLFVAEGHTGTNGSIFWSFSTKEVDLIGKLQRLLKTELGLNSYIQTINKNKTVTQVVTAGLLWRELFRSLCGLRAKSKRIHADLLAGPDEFLEGLFDGWMAGDGNKKRGAVCGATVSHELVLNMFDIANYFGWTATVVWEKAYQKGMIDGKAVGGDGVWKLTVYKEPKQRNSPKARSNYRVMDDKDCVWRRVRDVGKVAFTGTVYNIGVTGDNSYVAEGIGVHNCWGQQIRLTGSALTWMVPNYFGRPCELYSIPTAIAIPQPAINPDYPDGYYRIQPVYPYGPFSSYPTPTTAVGAAIGAQWMMKWKYPHPLLRYDGYSPQTGARLEMDSFEMVNRSRFYGLKRGINPSGVLNFDDVEGADPLPEDQIERIKADFENVQQGPENWGKLFVAAPGARLDPWGTVPRDMAYESGWDQLADFILGGVYGITKPAAGMIDNSSYATLFATLKQLNLITLEPECQMIASELTHQLAQFWGDDIIIEIRTPRIDDHDMKLAILSALQNARAVTKNEFRKELEMPVWRNPMGDEIAGTEPLPPMMDPAMMGMPPGAMPMQGMPGQMPMQGMPGEEVPGELEALLMEDTEGIPEGGDHETEIKRQQPIPGKLARGALGPRGASLDTDRLGAFFGTKSLYERLKEVLTNGH